MSVFIINAITKCVKMGIKKKHLAQIWADESPKGMVLGLVRP